MPARGPLLITLIAGLVIPAALVHAQAPGPPPPTRTHQERR